MNGCTDYLISYPRERVSFSSILFLLQYEFDKQIQETFHFLSLPTCPALTLATLT